MGTKFRNRIQAARGWHEINDIVADMIEHIEALRAWAILLAYVCGALILALAAEIYRH